MRVQSDLVKRNKCNYGQTQQQEWTNGSYFILLSKHVRLIKFLEPWTTNALSSTILPQFTILWVHMEYFEGFSMTPQTFLSNLCFWLDASCSRQYNLFTYALFLKKQRGYKLGLSLSLSLSLSDRRCGCSHITHNHGNSSNIWEQL
jgi:hypothetical protein